MPDRIAVFVGIILGSILYTPISIWVFGHAPSVMLDRTFFVLVGAGLMAIPFNKGEA